MDKAEQVYPFSTELRDAAALERRAGGGNRRRAPRSAADRVQIEPAETAGGSGRAQRALQGPERNGPVWR